MTVECAFLGRLVSSRVTRVAVRCIPSAAQGMQSCDIIVVIGKRKSQVIEALKSNVFDVVTSESREIKKPNKMQFKEDFPLTTTTIAVSLLCDSVAKTDVLSLSVMTSSTFDSNVSFLFCKLVFSLIFGRFASLFAL